MDNIHRTSDTSGRLSLAYLYGGVVRYQPGEMLGPRVLGDWELVLIIEGDVTYLTKGRNFAAPPGSIILARPGFEESYRWDPAHPTRHAFFHFDIEHMPVDWPDPQTWPICQQQPDPVLTAMFRYIVHHIYQHPDWPAQRPGVADCRLVETLIDIFCRQRVIEESRYEYARPDPVSRALRWMRQMIDDDPRRDIRLADVAQVAGVSDKHLCRLFTQSIHHPPLQTLNLMRLQLSLALLARTNLTIKQIAWRCGFDNPLYFSRCFSKVFAQPPRQVRRSIAEGQPPPSSPLPVDLTPRLVW